MLPTLLRSHYPAVRLGPRAADEEGGESMPVVSAADGVCLARQGTATPAQIQAAVAAARAALPSWRRTTPAYRGALLRAVADRIEARRDDLVALQRCVSGKPRVEAEFDVADAAACFAYYAQLCAEGIVDAAQPVALPMQGVSAQRRCEPVGVAALVVPWNFPMVTSAWKLAPALAAGCTAVLKPSELTTPMEHALLDILHEAGLPAGVVCMVCGGPAVGAALVADPGIDKISFTGSTAVGREVMKVAAERFKRVTLELGGKSALIVREDADVQQAVGLAVSGAFTNAGQMCSATSRILVHRSVHASFLQAMAQAVQGLVAGPDDLPGCTVGPIISAPHLARVEALLQRGCDAGAAMLCHGLVAHGAGAGHFMAPVVVAPADEQNVLWQEEIFGPIACVRAFDTDDEALAAANATAYGLVATVVTRSAEAASRYERELRAGLVWVNTPQLVFPQVCWGGLGASGLGRELGIEGLRSFQELRHAVVAPAS